MAENKTLTINESKKLIIVFKHNIELANELNKKLEKLRNKLDNLHK